MMTRTCSALPPWLACLALTLGAALSGCGEEEEGSPTMMPGSACLSCHGSGGSADDEVFSTAGTVYTDPAGTAPLPGATVSIVDDAGKQVSLTTNSAGNFYTRESLSFPLTVVVSDGTRDATMLSGASHGDCNACHAPGGSAGARISVP